MHTSLAPAHVQACALQPMDVVKTRLQLDNAGKYKGIVHCARTIAAEEGVRSLWKGLTPFATHLTIKYALRMTSNSMYQNMLRDKVRVHEGMHLPDLHAHVGRHNWEMHHCGVVVAGTSAALLAALCCVE
jgi:hypothetical protein